MNAAFALLLGPFGWVVALALFVRNVFFQVTWTIKWNGGKVEGSIEKRSNRTKAKNNRPDK